MDITGTIYIADSRCMAEVEEESIDLVITSPPYWQIKDYGVPGQIGYGQSLHEYLFDLSRVWRECHRVLRGGRRLCVNIGDQFARATIYGRYQVIPLHAEIIAQCLAIGFDYLGAIIWQKKTTMHTSGGAVVMGSFPYPPNGVVELDYEYILIFRKPGDTQPVPTPIKIQSKLTRDEWKEFFAGHWHFGGKRQTLHEAMFPEELPRRLIRMFSFAGDTVLDPFVGSGTTVKVALDLERNAIGYEIQPEFLPIIRQKLGMEPPTLMPPSIQFIQRECEVEPVEPPLNYRPHAPDTRPKLDPKRARLSRERLHKVTRIVDETTLRLGSGLSVGLLGIVVPTECRTQAVKYLTQYVLGARVFLRFDQGEPAVKGKPVPAYVYLSNQLFINRKMIEMGLAYADRECDHRYRAKFLEAERKHHTPSG